MESKKTADNFLVKDSKERLVKALDLLDLAIEKKITHLRSIHTAEIETLRNELSILEIKNRELAFDLEKTAISFDKAKHASEDIVHELDDTIDNLEKILRERHEGN